MGRYDVCRRCGHTHANCICDTHPFAEHDNARECRPRVNAPLPREHVRNTSGDWYAFIAGVAVAAVFYVAAYLVLLAKQQ